MSSISQRLRPLLTEMRDDLAEVGAILDRTPVSIIDGEVAGMDLRLRGLYQRLEATRRFLTLYRTPQPQNYNPARLLRDAAGQVGTMPEETGVLRAARVCFGDSEQVVECLRLLAGDAQRLRTTVMPGEEPPRVALEMHEGVPEGLSVDGYISVDWEAFQERWAAATNGGGIDTENQRVILYLEGTLEPPASVPGLEAPLKSLKQAVQRLRSWRGAIGHYEPGYASPEEIVSMYRETVARSIEAVEQVRRGM